MSARDDRFLRACRREPVDRPPVWFMRQAGRYMAEYRALRERHGLLELARTPELAAQVTLQPVRALGVDAAILFSDILIVLPPMGVGLEYRRGDGPAIEPLRDAAAIRALRPLEPARDLAFVGEAIAILRRELTVPLIGFAGAPFTLASYLLEGGHSRSYAITKQLMYGAPELWHELMRRLTDATIDYLRFQAAAGAQALQLFDSWVGCLAPEDYAAFVQPWSRRVLEGIADLGVPRIHFGTDTATLLEALRDAGGDVLGVDWRVPIEQARARLPGVAHQGNLDPCALLAPPGEAVRRALDVVRRAGPAPGYVFNVGHGILPTTPVETVRAVVEAVAARGAAAAAGDAGA